MRSIYISLLALIFFSCNSESGKLDINTDDISIEPVHVKRYGQALFNVDKSNLKPELRRLQNDYAVFLGDNIDDPINLMKVENFINDPLLIKAAEDCNNTFPDLGFLENELTIAFKHLKFYFPDFESPEVYTYISGFDHEYPIHYDGQIMLIAIDMYLGQNYGPYEKLGVPEYRIRKFSREYITRDCIEQVAQAINNSGFQGKKMLDLMVNKGKVLYFLDAIIPGTNDSIKIKYSGPQMEWAIHNESKFWAFLIENEILYSSDKIVEKKLLLDAPFTSYFGNESPPRLGEWIGWKIVSRFMETNPNTRMEDLLKNQDSQGILQKSQYKPKM